MMLIFLGTKLKDDAANVFVLQQTNTVKEELQCSWSLLYGSWLWYLQNRHMLQRPSYACFMLIEDITS